MKQSMDSRLAAVQEEPDIPASDTARLPTSPAHASAASSSKGGSEAVVGTSSSSIRERTALVEAEFHTWREEVEDMRKGIIDREGLPPRR